MLEIGGLTERAYQAPIGQQPGIFRHEELIEVGRAGGLRYLLSQKSGRETRKSNDKDRESEVAGPELFIAAHSELCLTSGEFLPGGRFAGRGGALPTRSAPSLAPLPPRICARKGLGACLIGSR